MMISNDPITIGTLLVMDVQHIPFGVRVPLPAAGR
jgi:hypothetical protein